MFNLIQSSNEVVFIPRTKVVFILWYTLGTKIAQKRLSKDRARRLYKHYRNSGFKRVTA